MCLATVYSLGENLGDHIHPGRTDFAKVDGLKGYRGRNKKSTDEDLIKADLHIDD